jgi:hypothetical protein
MLGTIKRKFSRTKSETVISHIRLEALKAEALRRETLRERRRSLTTSDENLMSRIQSSPETNVPTATKARKVQFAPAAVPVRPSPRTVFNDTNTGLLSLPTEILVVLQPYLRPSSEVSLRHSCSRFLNLYTTPSFYLSGDDKFDFICMTERDQDPRELARLVCGKCKELHNKAVFASSEIDQKPLDRDCRQVWLCAHRSLGYDKTVRSIKAGVETPFRVETLHPCTKCREIVRNRSVADRIENGTSETNLEDPRSESLLISKIALLQAPSPVHKTRGTAHGMYQETFPAKDVFDALSAINFRICPHLKLSDPVILSKFCRSCINTQRLPKGVKGPPCIGEIRREFDDFRKAGKCKGQCYFRGCKTQFMFQARESLSPDASGKRQVWLLIVSYRWLGPLLTQGKDSIWLDHSVDCHERVEMREAWENWDKTFRGRQCMPNWEICLLHPEDCNLR